MFSGAVSYAFARPDENFLPNNGALPASELLSESPDPSRMSSARPSLDIVDLGSDEYGEYMMSDALRETEEEATRTA